MPNSSVHQTKPPKLSDESSARCRPAGRFLWSRRWRWSARTSRYCSRATMRRKVWVGRWRRGLRFSRRNSAEWVPAEGARTPARQPARRRRYKTRYREERMLAAKVRVEPGQLLIDGRWVDGAKSFDTINPATGEVLTQIAEGSSADVDRAVAAARRALEDRDGPWRKMSASERGRLIWKLADLVEKHIDEFAELETLDNGKPIFESRHVDMPMVIDVLRYYAGLATKIHGETVNTLETAFTYTLREPVGVVGLIVPWNFPLLLASWKVGPALACGNTIVWKPASQTSLTALRFGKLVIEAGVPAGVINIVTGPGAVGKAMVQHPGIDKIAFTGSTAVGQEIMRGAADTVKRITLEHGGNGFFIEPTIFGDVNNDMTIAREEIFGPVLSVLTFDDIDEVIEQANNNPYGLAAAVWTRDVKKAHSVSRRLKAGTVWINTYGLMDASLPFGGYKSSGFCRELGMHAIEHYTELKTVWLTLG